MIDPDKTQKIPCIKRSLSVEEIAARELARLRHLESQMQTVRERLNQLGVAA